MAKGFYSSALEAFLSGNVSWTRDDIRAGLVDASYVFDPGHSSKEIPVIAASEALSDRSAAKGQAKSGNARFAQPTGPDVRGIVIFKVVLSPPGFQEKPEFVPIMFTDEYGADGLPETLVLNGGRVEISPDSTGVWFSL